MVMRYVVFDGLRLIFVLFFTVVHDGQRHEYPVMRICEYVHIA